MELTVSVGFPFVAVAMVTGQWPLGSHAVFVARARASVCARRRYSTEFHMFFHV